MLFVVYIGWYILCIGISSCFFVIIGNFFCINKLSVNFYCGVIIFDNEICWGNDLF